MNRRGTTIVELLIAATLFALVTVSGVSIFRALLLQAEVTAAARAVVAALHTARFEALTENEAVQASFPTGRIVLSRRRGSAWQPWRVWPLAAAVRLQASAKPVFSPLGSASPLCTVDVLVGGRYRRRITLAISGRVRVDAPP